MTSVAFAIERVRDVLEEIKPLLAEHWAEIALYRDRFPLRPAYDKYLAMDDMGLLQVATARLDGELIGYAVTFIMPHLHYQDCIVGQNDILFIQKEHRRGSVGMRLISYSEREMKKRGVHRAIYHVKRSHDFGALLERMGCRETERSFEKLLQDEGGRG